VEAQGGVGEGKTGTGRTPLDVRVYPDGVRRKRMTRGPRVSVREGRREGLPGGSALSARGGSEGRGWAPLGPELLGRV
jgi:hypothetical protein